MKTFIRTNQISKSYDTVLFADTELNTVSNTIISMYQQLYPNSEVFISLNATEETDTFMKNNIHFELVKSLREVAGYMTDQFFKEDLVYIDTEYLSQLSNLVQDKHLIIGPSFSMVPSFLHARTLDTLIEHDVSGVMYDTRALDLSDFKALQPLAKLRSYARNRIEIIPVVDSIEKRDELLKLIPFKTACII